MGVLRMGMKARRRDQVEVSIVFPAYNEANELEESVEKTIAAVERIAPSYEIIIAEDGSTDGTDKLASLLSKKYPSVERIHSEKRLGRGNALKNAFRGSKGEILIYMDVDLATDIRNLKALVDSIREGYDFATGSRMLPESKIERQLSRQIASKSYNFMVRALLGSKIKDHQCGFKAFKRDPLFGILEEVEASHWFWDTEILVRAARNGYEIKEIPVEWKSGRKTKVNLLKDSLNMGSQVLKLWWKLKTSSSSGSYL